jgi:hypothetical protein
VNFSAQTPPTFEGINFNSIGLAAVTVTGDQTNPGASIVVIYDAMNGSAGAAKVQIDCVSGDCNTVDRSLIAVYDDETEKMQGDSSMRNVWIDRYTDGFATVPLGEGTELCLTFTGLRGLDKGIRFYSSNDEASVTTNTALIDSKSGEGVRVCLKKQPR